MKAAIYQTANGYELRTHAGKLYAITPSGAGFIYRCCGSVGASWRGSGRLCKKVPDNLKRLFFDLVKK